MWRGREQDSAAGHKRRQGVAGRWGRGPLHARGDVDEREGELEDGQPEPCGDVSVGDGEEGAVGGEQERDSLAGQDGQSAAG